MTELGQPINEFRLTARLVNKDTIRYTPAGQAVLECQLDYSGTVFEAGTEKYKYKSWQSPLDKR